VAASRTTRKLVGLPLSLMLLALYLAAIYLAKIWVGAFLGRILLKSSGATKGDWLLGLLVGLLIVTIVGFIPYLGRLVHLDVVCLSLGAFACQLYRVSRPVSSRPRRINAVGQIGNGKWRVTRQPEVMNGRGRSGSCWVSLL
jgi:hypothetical protein